MAEIFVLMMLRTVMEGSEMAFCSYGLLDWGGSPTDNICENKKHAAVSQHWLTSINPAVTADRDIP